jgi:hypothetical protein
MVTLASYARRAGTQLIFSRFLAVLAFAPTWLLPSNAQPPAGFVIAAQRCDERLLQLQRRWHVF